MNVYESLNEMIQYIEENLATKIYYSKLAQFLGVNEYTMQSLFSLLCNTSIAEYIRKRRLSEAGFDIYNSDMKIIDVAIKYQYDNPTSFSRAFEKFHGIKPSSVKAHPEKLKLYTKLYFDESIQNTNSNIEYSIIEQNELILYGKSIKTDFQHISKDAPLFFSEIDTKYYLLYENIDYGMIIYEDRFESSNFEYCFL